jgi:hypothetical protein
VPPMSTARIQELMSFEPPNPRSASGIHISLYHYFDSCAGALCGITILGFLLRESLRITRAVGALVIQDEEKTRRLFPR